jgi:hypothetical protein
MTVNGEVGEPYQVRPNKALSIVTADTRLSWSLTKLALGQILLVGPFNFATIWTSSVGTKWKATHEHNRIDAIYWQLLAKRGNKLNVSVQGIYAEWSG